MCYILYAHVERVNNLLAPNTGFSCQEIIVNNYTIQYFILRITVGND